MNWEPINLTASEFDKPSLPPSLCGLVYAGKRHVLSGPPEAAKTVISLIVALEHMRAGGTVAFIDFESGPAETRRLLEDLGATKDEVGSVYYFEPSGPPAPDDIDRIVAYGITLVIIDAAAGAYGVSGLDDNKRQDARRSRAPGSGRSGSRASARSSATTFVKTSTTAADTRSAQNASSARPTFTSVSRRSSSSTAAQPGSSRSPPTRTAAAT